MKKSLILTAALLLIVALIFTACGNKEDGMVGNKANAQNGTRRSAEQMVTEAESKAKNAVDEAGERAGEAAKDAGDTVGDVVSGAADAAREGITGAGEVVSDIVSPDNNKNG